MRGSRYVTGLNDYVTTLLPLSAPKRRETPGGIKKSARNERDGHHLHPKTPSGRRLYTMSDAGSETASNHPEVEAQEVEVAAQSGPMSVEDALEQVIKTALVHDGLARGLRECAKALDKKEAHLCVLVETVTEGEFQLPVSRRAQGMLTFALKPSTSSSSRLSALSTVSSSSRSLTPRSLVSGPVSPRSTVRASPERSLAALALSSPTTVRTLPLSRSSLSVSLVILRFSSGICLLTV